MIDNIPNKKVNDEFVFRARAIFQYAILNELLCEEESYGEVNDIITENVSGLTFMIRSISTWDSSLRSE